MSDNFIRLTNITATGPGEVMYRVNIDHIVRYCRRGRSNEVSGSWVFLSHTTAELSVAESPETIDTLIQKAEERIYARSR